MPPQEHLAVPALCATAPAAAIAIGLAQGGRGEQEAMGPFMAERSQVPHSTNMAVHLLSFCFESLKWQKVVDLKLQTIT